MPDIRFGAWRARVDATLAAALPAAALSPQRLHAAMRHAALDGGKRMRPLLVYATGTAFGADEAALDAPAAAVELIHAYSLVHDDLPVMDDDALRRGKPTVHIAFDEATAILAGDALQSLAFELLATAPLAADARVAMLHELSVATGARGMCGGQALDIDATGKRGQSEVSQGRSRPGRDGGCEIHSDPFSPGDLERLHALKTGALLRASVRLGAIAANADPATLQRLDAFADALGLAFQIRDDLLDIEGDSATLGKTAGKDVAQAKATFPALLGVEASRARLRELDAAMTAALAPFGERTAALAALGQHAIERRS
ncbi:MAG TPA: polyprenyl synthetase family protein [Luteimonas sp.]|nr:polyprenyl synthetase family protein [Luteimonas sp.]